MDILHRIGIKDSSPQQVYRAITTLDGLAGWWTTDTTGDAGLGSVIQFRFIPGGFDMKVVDQRQDEYVGWAVVDGPEEWIGTTVTWDLAQDGDHTIVLFRHLGWREPNHFMHHCSTKWAVYLMSLKQLLETGTGSPSPYDTAISNWH